VPITHSDPRDDTAVLLPASIKRRLGLDDQPSWIITSDLNDFVWPGFDLRPVSRDEPDRFSRGYLPVELLQAVKAGIRANSQNRKIRSTNRD
jgi:hypothetical protein